MIHEERRYRIAPGKMPLILRRFENHSKDQEWIAIRAESEREGPLVEDIASGILKPTAFSPLQ